MRDLEYKINGRALELFAGSRLIAASIGGGKLSDIVPLWIDDLADEARAELVAELKQQDWVKNILKNGARKQV